MTLTRCCLLLALALFGCDDDDSGAPAEMPDRGVADGGLPDAQMPDAAQLDAQTPDAQTPDTGPIEIPTQLGGDRPAAFEAPSADPGPEARPLLVLLGGYDYFAADLDGWWGVRAAAAEAGAWLLLPDGTVDADGSPFWAATDTCCDFYDTGVDDVAYLTGLIEEAQAAVPVSRVVLVGHSNGAFMAYRMACERADLISAVVSVAGSGWLDPERCAPSQPVSILHAHGLLDDVMPFEGDSEAPGALEMMARWGRHNGCDDAGLQPTGETLDLLDDGQAADTEVFEHAGCAAQSRVRMWRFAEADHYPEVSAAFMSTALR